jgi:predicted DNA-binding antitoxin AbrB/MazE fold protein
MSIHIQATYRDGVIYPDQPLALPDATKVEVEVTSVERKVAHTPRTRPKAPQFTAAELEERLRRYAVSGPGLPIDFSREDIYRDHD